MRSICCAIAVALALCASGRAEAQVVVRNVAPAWAPEPVAPAALGTYTYNASYSVPVTYSIPYSYYAAWPNWPARGYVGYGPTDIFAFYGQPYGRPYDLWTWPYMSSSYYGGYLARYYYPPVR